MRRILFLDDNPARLRWATRVLGPGNLLTLTTTASDTIVALRDADHPFDVACLDHDLGDEVFADSDRPDTGMEVARWVRDAPVPSSPTRLFVVHSLNAPAANRMVATLMDAGYEAIYVPFLLLINRIDLILGANHA